MLLNYSSHHYCPLVMHAVADGSRSPTTPEAACDLPLKVPEKDWLVTEWCLFVCKIMVIPVEHIHRIDTSVLARSLV